MDIGIASVAAAVTLDADGRCTDCRIALGAVSPVPLRATAAEDALRGERITAALADTSRWAGRAAAPTDLRHPRLGCVSTRDRARADGAGRPAGGGTGRNGRCAMTDGT